MISAPKQVYSHKNSEDVECLRLPMVMLTQPRVQVCDRKYFAERKKRRTRCVESPRRSRRIEREQVTMTIENNSKKIYWIVRYLLRHNDGNVRRDVMFRRAGGKLRRAGMYLRPDGNLPSTEKHTRQKDNEPSIGRKCPSRGENVAEYESSYGRLVNGSSGL